MLRVIACAILLALPVSGPMTASDHGKTWGALCDGLQVIPPITSLPSAAIYMTQKDENQWTDPIDCWLHIEYSNLSGPPTGVFMRWGHVGVNGPLAFTVVDSAFANPFFGSIAIPLHLIDIVYSDSLYMVVSTAAYPDGEARGQFADLTDPAVLRTSWGLIRSSYR